MHCPILVAALFCWLSVGSLAEYSRYNQERMKCYEAYQQVSTENLRGLFVFMRHGTRAPWTTYPKDPHINNTYRWPNGRSQLTDLGINQAKYMAQLLKARYGYYITKQNPKTNVWLRSSAAQRCVDTLDVMTNSLFDKNGYLIHTVPKQIDSLLYEEPFCPNATDEEEKNMNQADVLEYNSILENFYHYVANFTGLEADMDSVNKAFDCVRCEQLNHNYMPRWAQTNHTYKQMGDVYTHHLRFLYASQKSLRFRAGPVLDELVKNMNLLNRTKIFLYTTHDYKIAAILLALGEKLNKYPDFASSIIFEVHDDPYGNDSIIKAFYVTDTAKPPYSITELYLDECKQKGEIFCKGQNFKRFYAKYLNVKWTEECNINTTSFDVIQELEDNIMDH